MSGYEWTVRQSRRPVTWACQTGEHAQHRSWRAALRCMMRAEKQDA